MNAAPISALVSVANRARSVPRVGLAAAPQILRGARTSRCTRELAVSPHASSWVAYPTAYLRALGATHWQVATCRPERREGQRIHVDDRRRLETPGAARERMEHRVACWGGRTQKIGPPSGAAASPPGTRTQTGTQADATGYIGAWASRENQHAIVVMFFNFCEY